MPPCGSPLENPACGETDRAASSAKKSPECRACDRPTAPCAVFRPSAHLGFLGQYAPVSGVVQALEQAREGERPVAGSAALVQEDDRAWKDILHDAAHDGGWSGRATVAASRGPACDGK